MRLDQFLASNGHFSTRSRARDAVLRGCVRVDGEKVLRPGQKVDEGATIMIDDPASAYVSRAALKLLAGIEASGFEAAGKSCLDIGASTGGFTQVLLEQGAAHVTAIDVGHRQMPDRIASHPKVTNLEGINARNFNAELMGGRAIDFIVCDVSFISLKLALPPALTLALPGACGIFLVKPQFEAGRAHIGKGGLLRDPSTGLQMADELTNWMDKQDGWLHTLLLPSPVKGGDGNIEFLLCARKT